MAFLDSQSARSVLDALAVSLLGVVLASVLVYKLRTSVAIVALQGLLLAGAACTVALATGEGHAYVAAGLTLAVKAVALPVMLLRTLYWTAAATESEPVLSRKLALPLAVGLVLFAYRAAGPLVQPSGFLTQNTVPAAVAILLLGFLLMLLRRKPLSQIVALITMENGLYLAAVVATRGLPLAVEMGIAVDVLVAVGVMGIVSRNVERVFPSADVDLLRGLRG